ncbi:MAG: YtxH domain-containing protein, partial [Lachnospiraceae bacterium]|nr:YtxH domain-containing protein [Lachnospiraceae bacterium]
AAEGITDLQNGYLIEEDAADMARVLREACKDLDRVHEVGQNAMDEIYLSWDSAVRSAVDRYGAVIELHKSCSMTERKYQTSDHFVSAATSLVGATEKVFQAPRRLYEGMLENVNDVKERLQDAKDDVKERIQGAKDDMKERLQDAKDDVRARVQDAKDTINKLLS